MEQNIRGQVTFCLRQWRYCFLLGIFLVFFSHKKTEIISTHSHVHKQTGGQTTETDTFLLVETKRPEPRINPRLYSYRNDHRALLHFGLLNGPSFQELATSLLGSRLYNGSLRCPIRLAAAAWLAPGPGAGPVHGNERSHTTLQGATRYHLPAKVEPKNDNVQRHFFAQAIWVTLVREKSREAFVLL